ncbi:Transforming growth factor beta-1-induced transcript 1 protein [Desmophyllum pertusum]|uniref:Transforming growth factor beta-1-induced transcript 1 protein n=1 Tax=Desmophyllum pertusum TaxID=174260 RepID=A0A9W9YL31_9CNID|nr:Transforming growth factor beta-1-induced transcript 1 protein [Desmophyllum pertusum]
MFPPPASSSSLGQNLSELDSLLENLSNPLQYPDPPAGRLSAGSPRGSQSSPSPKPAVNGRPSSYKGPVTAVAHDNRPADTRYGERNGPESSKVQVAMSHVAMPAPLRGQLQQTRDIDRQSRTASTATKELDDLMASLSDFKVNVTAAPTPSQARLSGDYAKPIKSTKPSSPAAVGKVSQLDSMLGSLQSDMTRQGVSTTKKGECAACSKPIIGQVCTALGRTWHPEHFTCVTCEVPLGATNFFERDGKPFCERDYHEQFAPRCAYCNGPILDECHQAFPGGSFFEHEGRPYCEMHYHARRGTLCYSCQKPITGRCITAMHRKFHPEHFVCAFCLKQLNKGTFKEQNDKPYCHPCFIKLFG